MHVIAALLHLRNKKIFQVVHSPDCLHVFIARCAAHGRFMHARIIGDIPVRQGPQVSGSLQQKFTLVLHN